MIDIVLQAKALNNSIYAHMFNVAVMSCIVAKWGGVGKERFGPVFICGLLHDIGRVDCQCEKSSPQYMRHTTDGYLVLSRGNNKLIDSHVRNVCMQHHEYCDGSGYPYKLHSQDLDDYSKIVTISNDFMDIVEKGASARGAVSIMCDVRERYDRTYFDSFLDKMTKIYSNH